MKHNVKVEGAGRKARCRPSDLVRKIACRQRKARARVGRIRNNAVERNDGDLHMRTGRNRAGKKCETEVGRNRKRRRDDGRQEERRGERGGDEAGEMAHDVDSWRRAGGGQSQMTLTEVVSVSLPDAFRAVSRTV
jgi:hypothetical protein